MKQCLFTNDSTYFLQDKVSLREHKTQYLYSLNIVLCMLIMKSQRQHGLVTTENLQRVNYLVSKVLKYKVSISLIIIHSTNKITLKEFCKFFKQC